MLGACTCDGGPDHCCGFFLDLRPIQEGLRLACSPGRELVVDSFLPVLGDDAPPGWRPRIQWDGPAADGHLLLHPGVTDTVDYEPVPVDTPTGRVAATPRFLEGGVGDAASDDELAAEQDAVDEGARGTEPSSSADAPAFAASVPHSFTAGPAGSRTETLPMRALQGPRLEVLVTCMVSYGIQLLGVCSL